MNTQVLSTEERLRHLDVELRRLRTALVLTVAVCGSSIWTARPGAQAATDPLRVRGLVVEDANGRPRIVLGAALSDGRAGLQINDEAGAERLGLSLQRNGNMVLGFDAPPGTGDPRNRERIRTAQ